MTFELTSNRPWLQVTASTLVRHFGEWQERAARAPVYVLHHGRPRLVLLGMELMESLATAPTPRAVDSVGPILDALELPLMLVDRRGQITHDNAASRARFGSFVAAHADVTALSRRDGESLAAAVRRVLDGASRERVSIVSDRLPGRVLSVTIEPLPEGCLLRVDDETATFEAGAASATRDAIIGAIEATDQAVIVRVSLRGYVVDPGPALATLLQQPPAGLGGAKFLALVAPADQPSVSDSLERASEGETGKTASAGLMTGNGEALASTLCFWPIRVNGRVEEVVAAVVRRAA
jgi:hypothetical protein